MLQTVAQIAVLSKEFVSACSHNYKIIKFQSAIHGSRISRANNSNNGRDNLEYIWLSGLVTMQKTKNRSWKVVWGLSIFYCLIICWVWINLNTISVRGIASLLTEENGFDYFKVTSWLNWINFSLLGIIVIKIKNQKKKVLRYAIKRIPGSRFNIFHRKTKLIIKVQPP